MYNDSVIQEQSGLNAFYNKIYSLVGIGVGISALVSGLMMTVFQDFFVQILTTAPMVYYGAVVVELILVFVASGKAVKNSPSALPIFLIYS
ncbi:MAG: BAX inhibitor (BI)-1/YccA family protein, partial [Streptococcus parasanguinis]|nr:BAX inhibitor (BI)-1/YccA family protein [Streptococcus parasanguinis]